MSTQSPRITARVLRTAATAALIGAVALGTGAGFANAEPTLSATDREFLRSMDDARIDYSSPSGVIELAGMVCDQVASGTSTEALFDATTDGTGLSADQADTFLFESLWNYCPQYLAYLAQ